MSATTYNNVNELPATETKPAVPRRRRFYLILIGGGVLVLALIVGFIPRLKQREMSAADTTQLATATVAVVSPISTTPGSGLNLPAEVKSWQEASIFSRVNGYLRAGPWISARMSTQDKYWLKSTSPIYSNKWIRRNLS